MMRHIKSHFQASWLLSFVTLTSVTAIWPQVGLAQLLPDDTLGIENSVVVPNVDIDGEPVDLIEGGATRGVNLFHSFSEFNIEAGQQVYFANPSDIATILSRVTGQSPSDINGVMGVLGTADLFLINPNGIMFGPNAELDIPGSFVVSTADDFQLGEGLTFSAVSPEEAPLLTVHIAPGVQYGTIQSGTTISNQGKLSVGQDLTLASDTLDLQGEVWADENLSLHAQDILQIRDNEVNPFIAAAGEQLLLQGNQTVDIFALNHAESGMFSGGDMVLRSINPVSGDAHYWSGGNFRVEQLDKQLGQLVSPYDPIIRASGDVEFESYEGASLHILAGGSVTIPGEIIITGPDAINSIQALVTLSDSETMLEIDGSTQPTVDIRAGTTAFAVPSIIGNTAGFIPDIPNPNGIGSRADITLGNIANPGGLVFLTNQLQPDTTLPGGDIQVGSIDTSLTTEVSQSTNGMINLQIQGGNIVLDSRGDIELTGDMKAGAIVRVGSFFLPVVSNAEIEAIGGSITLITNRNAITQELNTSARVDVNITDGIPGDRIANGASALVTGGEITADVGNTLTMADLNTSATVNVIADASVRSFLRSATAGEIKDVRAVAEGGEISLNLKGPLSANSLNTSADATALARANAFTNNNPFGLSPILAVAFAGDVGNTTAEASGGTINLVTESSLILGNLNSSAEADSISETEARGYAGTFGFSGNTGDAITVTVGGDITLNATNSFITIGDIEAFADAFAFTSSRVVSQEDDFSFRFANVGDSGNVSTVALGGDIKVNSDSLLTRELNSSANGIAIPLAQAAVARTVQVDPGRTGDLSATIKGGTITVDTSGDLSTGDVSSFANTVILPIVLGGSEAGDIQVDGRGGPILLNAGDNLATANLTSSVDVDLSVDETGLGNFREATAGGDITLNARNALIAGSIDSSAVAPTPGGIDITEGVIASAASGAISLSSSAGEVSLIDALMLSNIAVGDGNGGDIMIDANSVQLINTDINASIVGLGDPGSIIVNSRGPALFDGSRVITGLESEAEASQLKESNISITAESVEFSNFSLLNTTTFGVGNAGDITVNADSLISLEDSSLFSLTAGQGDAGKILLQAEGPIEVNGNSVISTAVALGAVGDGGPIMLQSADRINISGVGTLSDGSSQGGLLGPVVNEQETDISFFDFPLGFESPEEVAEIIQALQEKLQDAQNIDDFFSLDSSVNANPDVEFSTEIPYVSILGQSGNDTYDIYSFTVKSAGTQLTFDIDNVESQEEPLNTALSLFDSQINLLAASNDASQRLGADGSVSQDDAYLTYIFNEPGQYFIRVSEFFEGANRERALRTSGNYTLQVSKVENFLVNSGISAQTRGDGTAGNTTIKTPQLSIQNAGQVAVSADGLGNAGDIILDVPDQVVLQDGSRLSVSSQGDGIGGDINVRTGLLRLENQASLFAETFSTQGGDITLNIDDLLVMRDNSFISTTAGTAQSGGDGGDIIINAPIVFAVPDENSDIIANAFDGNGGRVEINAQDVIGFTLRSREDLQTLLGTNEPTELDPRRLPSSDITAISQGNPSVNSQGEVVVNTLGVDPDQGLLELPSNLADQSNQIAQRCLADSGQNAFVVTGRGGVPPIPSEVVSEAIGLIDLETYEDDQLPASTTTNNDNISPETPIVKASPSLTEAQNWIVNEVGEVELMAQVIAPTPRFSHTNSLCPTP
ncbi:two-partner secretion domain-containing protein [Leptothoe spongobia]|uniref:Filamentous hemagglutinin N-terminal domain-containing protein n=1 Tax=Leptothoe spongobia TAU-MAC 1115 TaxID=1967444 RepID=A0A947DGI0_9CYAN|nr:filamentous hemagglutinin N-terminal domain-containing protein [Leptothoe spongobia]MBT9316234.1 filamentous hemagglutinin N-terminal domain-containing protein [Leptothoe spongobia TAU-MAC 1115]